MTSAQPSWFYSFDVENGKCGNVFFFLFILIKHADLTVEIRRDNIVISQFMSWRRGNGARLNEEPFSPPVNMEA